MEDKVKVKIKPLHNIGGVGKAGDVVWMSVDDVNLYLKEGYIELIPPSDTPPPAPPSPQPSPLQGEGADDHAVMKPEVKRAAKKVVRKK